MTNILFGMKTVQVFEAVNHRLSVRLCEQVWVYPDSNHLLPPEIAERDNYVFVCLCLYVCFVQYCGMLLDICII